MKQKELLGKIESKGYWRIHFQPKSDMMLPLTRCKELVEKNTVQLRGWDYPHVPKRTGDDTGLVPGDNYWQGWIDWDNHIELWRMYQSGQFIHYRALHEDWTPDLVVNSIWERNEEPVKSGEILSTLGTVYLLTEIYQFLSRLATDGLYNKGIRTSISLNNTEGRKLAITDYRRVPFSYDRKTAAQTIELNNSYIQKALIEEPVELARKAIFYFFERFDWTPSEEMIKTDQENLLARKI